MIIKIILCFSCLILIEPAFKYIEIIHSDFLDYFIQFIVNFKKEVTILTKQYEKNPYLK